MSSSWSGDRAVVRTTLRSSARGSPRKAAIHLSSITGGEATETGGGIYGAGKLSVISATISGNDASADGGGLFMGQGRAKVTASTIVENSAGIFGITADQSPLGKRGVVRLRTTLVADNIDIGGDNDCATISKGRIVSRGLNLLENCSVAKPKKIDLAGLEPMLAPLGGDGLHFPLPGSPVIDAVNRRTYCKHQDARFVVRAVPCDIGAVEVP